MLTMLLIVALTNLMNLLYIHSCKTCTSLSTREVSNHDYEYVFSRIIFNSWLLWLIKYIHMYKV